MDEHGTDSPSADTAVEPADAAPDTSTSAIDTRPADVGEPVDLAASPVAAAVKDGPVDVVKDFGASPVEAFSDSLGDSGVEEPIDLSEPMDNQSTINSAAPHDWSEGEVIDLGAGTDVERELEPETVDSSDDGEDLAVLVRSDGEDADPGTNQPDVPFNAEAEDLTTAPMDSDEVLEPAEVADLNDAIGEIIADAESEARSTESWRAEWEIQSEEEFGPQFDADVDALLNSDAHGQEASAEQPPVAGSDATDPVPSSDQPDTPDLRNAPDNEALAAALAERGLVLETVDRFDYTDNPILGYRESATPEDIGYAVKAWNDQIAPGLSSGATRKDFEAYDRERGLEGHQRLAGVYDYFLGGDAIKSGGERDDGTLDVTGGRHRLEQARLHGIAYLPVKK